MKKLFILPVLLLHVNDANAIIALKCSKVTCTDAMITAAEQWPYTISLADGDSYEDICYYNSSLDKYAHVRNATSCGTGRVLTSTSYDMSVVCTTPPIYNICQSECTGCSNCTSDTTWSSTGTAGYEKKVTRTCSCNTCYASTTYRCTAGYYGSSTNGTSGCTRCPSSGGVYGTSTAGSTAITSCYIPSNSSMTDTTGSYTFTSNCYYSN